MSSTAQPPGAPPGRNRALWGLTVLSALLLGLAFPPASIGAFAWIGLVPLILALSQISPLRGLAQGLIFGLLFMGSVCWFVSTLGMLPWAALTLGMGAYYAVFGLVASLICQQAPAAARVPALAAAWTLLEIIRGSAGPIALTLGDLAYSQHTQLPIVQFASLTGHYGVTFLIALLNAGLATVLLGMFPRTWRRPGHPLLFNRLAGRMALVCYIAVFAVYIWGSLVMRLGQGLERQRAETGPTLSVAVVQAVLPVSQQVTRDEVAASLRAYDELSKLSPPAKLIVWPETAVPATITNDRDSQQRVKDVARREQADLLFGAIEAAGPDIYNAAFRATPDGELRSVYRKCDLVIFGEYVPFREQWKFLQRYPIRMQDFSPGSKRRLVTVRDWHLAPLICYEGIFPEPAREVTRLGADVIALITSDIWAAHTAEPAHHSVTAPFRAIETRRYLIRAASNGVSAIYDPYGEALDEVPIGIPGVARAEIPAGSRHLTTYTRYGNAPLILVCTAFLVLGLLTRAPLPPPSDTN